MQILKNDQAGVYTYRDDRGCIYNQFGRESNVRPGHYTWHEITVTHDDPNYPLYTMRVVEQVADYIPGGSQ